MTDTIAVLYDPKHLSLRFFINILHEHHNLSIPPIRITYPIIPPGLRTSAKEQLR